MQDRSHNCQRWKGSLSQRGFAWTRPVVAILLLVGLVMLLVSLFPTREERLWKLLDGARAAFVEGREEDFLAIFDPAVRYQKTRGLADIQRDYARWKKQAWVVPNITKRAATLDETGADVFLDVVVSMELRPVAQAKVKLRLLDSDGPWRVTEVSWD